MKISLFSNKFLVVYLSLASTFLISTANACGCAGEAPLSAVEIVTNYLVLNHSVEKENIEVVSNMRRPTFLDRALYVIDGRPTKAQSGGNCWYFNSEDQPLFQCNDKTHTELVVDYSNSTQTCTQAFDVVAQPKSFKLKSKKPLCKEL
jgi:hypothetical protein